jgi:hypothetical protein
MVSEGGDRRSMALVVTLVLVTLVSALVVAFVMRARLDLAAAGSYAAVPQADGIGRGGVEFLVGWLRREIQMGSDGFDASGDAASGEDAVVFAPLGEANFLPQRVATRQGGSGGYQSLVRMSRGGEQFFTASGGWQFNGGGEFDVVSDVSTAKGSANGRRFGAGRWAAPGLLTREEAEELAAGDGGGEGLVPDWVYVTRRGPERVTEAGESQRDEDSENLDYVLGRFAYAIYDVSGLLDVGVAGYPGGLEDYGVESKGALAWADPSAMGLPGGATVDREGLVAWRNRATSSDYMNFVTNAIKEGFRTNAAGDNGFFGRGDLVGFARGAATRQVLDTNALPYLTVFSRERAAPSWWPRIPEALRASCDVEYEEEAFEKGSTNRWAAGVLVQQDFTAPDGTEFRAGEPLLKRRFALSRINLLRADSGADARTIWYHFGLVRRGEAGRGTGVPEWVYNPRSPSAQEIREIYTLDEVAARGDREPNFFELIAAGVLHGSVAKSGRQESMDFRLGRDRSAYHQILQIGANIIDQYDEDEIPTVIRSISDDANNQGYSQTINLLASTIRGIENLPYINHIIFTMVRDRSKQSPNGDWVKPPYLDPQYNNLTPWATEFMQFTMWNPHRNAIEADPASYRVIARTGSTYLEYPNGRPGHYDAYLQYHNVRQNYPPTKYGRNFASSPGGVEFETGQAFFEQPRLLRPDDSAIGPKVINAIDVFRVQGANVTGLRLGDSLIVCNLDTNKNIYDDYYWTFINNAGVEQECNNHINAYFQANAPLVIELQKKVNGAWLTYQVHCPKKAGSRLGGIPGINQPSTAWNPASVHNNVYMRNWPVANNFNVISDPRCQRYGFTHGGGFSHGTQYDYRKVVGDTSTSFEGKTIRFKDPSKRYYGAPGNGTRLTEAGWQFPAWIAPYAAQNGIGDDIELDKDNLWFWHWDQVYYQTAYAEFAENSAEQPRMGGKSLMYARDNDKLVRRGDGWRFRDVDPYSMEDKAENNVARPVFMNRPFQSVGELGYVQRDDPWKTLNLFWGDSADSGLLDLFCLEEGETFRPVRAGVVNPNTAPREVLAAVLAGTAAHGKVAGNDPPRLDSAAAEQLADEIRTYLGPLENPTRVLRNIGDIAEMCEEVFESGGAAQGALGDMKNTDTGRETVARALADVCNTRTWNLFIDMVAQAGRFTDGSRAPEDFLVRGERRLWVHLALDRITGEVVDVDIEPVFE